MPQSVLSVERVRSFLSSPVSDARLTDLLFASKAEVEKLDGDALTVSVTPDRLDLLSEAGLSLELGGALGLARGILRFRVDPATDRSAVFEVDASVDRLRPVIAGYRVRAPPGSGLDPGTLEEAIRFQELIHETVGRGRRTASIGIYPWEKIEPPVSYSLETLDRVRFVPLDGTEEMAATSFFGTHPLAARYGAYGREGGSCLVLRDAAGSILSLPPVLNSRTAGESRVGDRELLIESTGTQARSVEESLGLLLVVFAVRGWSVIPVPVVGPGPRRDPGRAAVAMRSVRLPSRLLGEMAGESLASAEVVRRLGRARLGVRPQAGGWRVEVPPWRPDLRNPVDAVEDVILAVPLSPEGAVVPPSFRRGRRRPETMFRRRVATDLIGLGFAAPYTSLLVSDARVAQLGSTSPIRLHNPVSTEFAYLRDRILLSHLDVLAHNTRHGYPQRFAEVGPVVVRHPSAESGSETRYHASLVVAADPVGFSDAAALVDYLLRRRDVLAVREPSELPGLIPGRSARSRVAGETVAELGEIHPSVLIHLGVPVPAVWAEIDLTTLWTLVGPREAA